MEHPYYTFSVPILKKKLTNLNALLTKAEAFITEKGMTEEELFDARLAPDMFPFVRQVQIATDNAKGIAARLSSTEAPVMEDTETSIAELRARIEKTLAYLDTFTPEQFREAADTEVRLKYFDGKHFTGHGYFTEYGLPNFFFHYTIAYAILRHLGMEMGKADFMGPLPLIAD